MFRPLVVRPQGRNASCVDGPKRHTDQYTCNDRGKNGRLDPHGPQLGGRPPEGEHEEEQQEAIDDGAYDLQPREPRLPTEPGAIGLDPLQEHAHPRTEGWKQQRPDQAREAGDGEFELVGSDEGLAHRRACYLVGVTQQTSANAFAFALALVLAASACARDRIRVPAQVRADTLATVGEQRGQSPGIAVATVHDASEGEPEITVEVGGLAALADERLVEADTAFLWFSITKLFTATAIMQLHERGKLDIDAPVHDLLGEEWTIVEPRERPVTARDLLSHSSGLGNPAVWDAAAPEGRPRSSVEDQLAQLLQRHGRRLHYYPGRDQIYSNLGYLALGRMIEVADGRDYETYVRDEILDVLDMDRTGFRWAPLLDDGAVGHSRKGQFWTTVAKRVANPEVFGPELPRWITTKYFEVEGTPYGGLIGTAGDLGKFLAAHLQHGQWQGRRILSPTSVQAMQTVQRDHRGRPFDYALGWHTQLIQGERYFNHMGKGGGYRPAVYIWPSRRYGLAILTNQTYYDPRPLAECVPPLSVQSRSTAPN